MTDAAAISMTKFQTTARSLCQGIVGKALKRPPIDPNQVTIQIDVCLTEQTIVIEYIVCFMSHLKQDYTKVNAEMQKSTK